MSTPPLAIGADVWPGLAKLAEECAEVVQVVAKLAAYPDGEHPDGQGDLVERLQDEIADARAATDYVIRANDLSESAVIRRERRKVRQFDAWHIEERHR